jgi:hypothetical protein
MSTANGFYPSAPMPINVAIANESINVQDIISLTAKLAKLLAEEVDLLSDMKVEKIESLQQEKLFLVGALSAQRKKIEQNPQALETIPSQDKRDLEEVVEVFNTILEENHRKLLMAKDVNNRIVQAITAVVKQKAQKRTYNGKGVTGMNPYESASITLNTNI